jgi:GTP-binding protein Era
MPEQPSSGQFRSGYVALIGAPNVGKSTLLNQLLKEKISITAPKPQTTRNRVLGILSEPDCQVVFVDTPGIHNPRDQFNRILVDTALSTLSEVDTVCFLVDPSEGGREINDFMIQNLERVKSPLVLAINKIDLMRDKGMLLPMIQKYSSLLPFEAVIPISALTGDGVGELLDEIKRLLPEGPRYFPEDYLTDQPERFFVSEIVREKIFRLLHEEVPYAVAVTVEKFSEEPERNFIHIEATVNVERDSQKAIIIGKKGQMLKEIGSQARRDIEVLLGCRVYLGLFVRVQKNWRKDRRALQEFGYHSKK